MKQTPCLLLLAAVSTRLLLLLVVAPVRSFSPSYACRFRRRRPSSSSSLVSRRHVLSSKELEAIATTPNNNNNNNNNNDDESQPPPPCERHQPQLLACAIDYKDISSPFMSRLDSESTFVDYAQDGIAVPAGPVGQVKEDIANLLNEPIVEVIIGASVLLNSLLVAVGTVDAMEGYDGYLRGMENAIGLVLAMEFGARWFSSSKESFRHVVSPQFVVDWIVVILPLVFGLTPSSFWSDTWLPDWLTAPSSIINLKLLRLLRLQRVLQDLETFSKFEHALGLTNNQQVEEWQLQLARVSLSIFTLLSVSAGLIYTAEQGVNPDMTDYFTALYFGITSLSTVGYGDITPQTWAGKLVVSGSIIAGVAILPGQAASLVEALLKRQEAGRRPKRRRRGTTSGTISPLNGDMSSSQDGNLVALDTAMACPNCQATLHWSTARFCYACGDELA